MAAALSSRLRLLVYEAVTASIRFVPEAQWVITINDPDPFSLSWKNHVVSAAYLGFLRTSFDPYEPVETSPDSSRRTDRLALTTTRLRNNQVCFRLPQPREKAPKDQLNSTVSQNLASHFGWLAAG